MFYNFMFKLYKSSLKIRTVRTLLFAPKHHALSSSTTGRRETDKTSINFSAEKKKHFIQDYNECVFRKLVYH